MQCCNRFANDHTPILGNHDYRCKFMWYMYLFLTLVLKQLSKGITVCRYIYLKAVETCYYFLFFDPCRMIEEKHRGHDLMHAEMFLILFGSIMVAQILLFLWRQKHSRSYQVKYTCRCLLEYTVVYYSLL